MPDLEISRQTYKQIKGMDRAALNAYLMKLYTKAYATGFAAGKKAVKKDPAPAEPPEEGGAT